MEIIHSIYKVLNVMHTLRQQCKWFTNTSDLFVWFLNSNENQGP